MGVCQSSWRDFEIIVIEGRIPGSHEPPAYGVCLLEADQMIVHLHDYLDRTNTFLL